MKRGRMVFNVAATYFSTHVLGSIIGPLELNGRVRDGNGCDLQGKATTKGKNEGCSSAPTSRRRSGILSKLSFLNVID